MDQSSHPLLFNGTSGIVEGKGGHKYSFDLEVKKSPEGHIGDIAVIELVKFLPNYKEICEKAFHTLFVEDEDYMTYSVVLRNNWGTHHPTFNATIGQDGWVMQFAVTVKNFVWLKEGEPVVICGPEASEWEELQEYPDEYADQN